MGKRGFLRHVQENKSHLDLMISWNRGFGINIQMKNIIHALLMKKQTGEYT